MVGIARLRHLMMTIPKCRLYDVGADMWSCLHPFIPIPSKAIPTMKSGRVGDHSDNMECVVAVKLGVKDVGLKMRHVGPL